MTTFRHYRLLRAMARYDRLCGREDTARALDQLADRLAVAFARRP